MKKISLVVSFVWLGTALLLCPLYAGHQKVVDVDGNFYHTVTIGKQTWMVKNLKVTKYRDGTPIPEVSDDKAWVNLTSGAYCNYNNNLDNVAVYGRLYNFYAIIDPRGLCPKGWHVPTDGEWQILIDHLGGEKVAGGKLKEVGENHWGKNVGATNLTGFTALPGGRRECAQYVDGVNSRFDWLGLRGFFGSCTEWGRDDEGCPYPWSRDLSDINPYVNREHYSGCNGISVRCIKD